MLLMHSIILFVSLSDDNNPIAPVFILLNSTVHVIVMIVVVRIIIIVIDIIFLEHFQLLCGRSSIVLLSSSLVNMESYGPMVNNVLLSYNCRLHYLDGLVRLNLKPVLPAIVLESTLE
jgi:hypothetical protein